MKTQKPLIPLLSWGTFSPIEYQTLEDFNRQHVRRSFEKQLSKLGRIQEQYFTLQTRLNELEEIKGDHSSEIEQKKNESSDAYDQYRICHARLKEELNNDLRRPIPLLDATNLEAQSLLNCISKKKNKFGSMPSTLKRLTHFRDFNHIVVYVCSDDNKKGNKTVKVLNDIAIENHLG